MLIITSRSVNDCQHKVKDSGSVDFSNIQSATHNQFQPLVACKMDNDKTTTTANESLNSANFAYSTAKQPADAAFRTKRNDGIRAN